MWQTDSTAHKLKSRLFYKSTQLWVHLADFHPSVNHAWQYYQTLKSAVASEQFYLQKNLSTSKSKMASSCHNSSTSTSVLLLGTPFNTISHFSDHLVYLPNTPWHTRQIHQRCCSSLRSPSSTIQPGRIVLLVSGPSIILVDNDHNWENAPATNPTTNLTANRPTSSTCSWSKLH